MATISVSTTEAMSSLIRAVGQTLAIHAVYAEKISSEWWGQYGVWVCGYTDRDVRRTDRGQISLYSHTHTHTYIYIYRDVYYTYGVISSSLYLS